MAPTPEELFALAPRYLERQRWYLETVAADPVAPLQLVAAEVLAAGPPGLARLVVGRGGRRLQLLLGWRPATEISGLLRNEDRSLLGTVQGDEGASIVYDALADDALMCLVLEIATDHAERAQRVRPVSTLTSHASLVFDERLFMKCYRVLEPGPRPEVEVLFGLDEVGFNALLAPVGRWRRDGQDLALVREFLPSALEGRLLALTSLRDLLAHASPSDEQDLAGEGATGSEEADRAAARAGGDLSSEMLRLGETTAHLHLALARAFGSGALDPADLAGELGASPAAGVALGRPLAEFAALGAASLGASIQLHGDYHLRRVMRSESGWLVAGFGDDPLYATSAPRPSLALRRGSAVEDLADMTFALGRVAAEALAQRPSEESELARALAGAWTRRNRSAFLRGYQSVGEIGALVPEDPGVLADLLHALEALRSERYEATSSLA